MDQTLQARLIGATVLVALAVLLIPELLSGRKTVEPAVDEGAAARGSRTFTIELGGSGGQPAASAPPAAPSVASASRTPAAPAVDPTSPTATPGVVAKADLPAEGERAVPEESRSAVASGAAAKALPAQPPSPAAGSAGGWVVQVGAFGSAEAARRLVGELAAAGYSAQVAPVTRAGKTLHRVRVGPAGGRPAAQQLAERLAARGLPAAVVAND
jgi:DedD protein